MYSPLSPPSQPSSQSGRGHRVLPRAPLQDPPGARQLPPGPAGPALPRGAEAPPRGAARGGAESLTQPVGRLMIELLSLNSVQPTHPNRPTNQPTNRPTNHPPKPGPHLQGRRVARRVAAVGLQDRVQRARGAGALRRESWLVGWLVGWKCAQLFVGWFKRAQGHTQHTYILPPAPEHCTSHPQVGYSDPQEAGRRRPVMHRGSVVEMSVPYAGGSAGRSVALFGVGWPVNLSVVVWRWSRQL